MSAGARRPRAGRIVGWGVAAVAGLLFWGVPIDAARVGRLVADADPVRLRAAGAWIALRPLPTIIASDVRMSFEGRVRADLSSVAIVLGLRPLLRGDAAWRRARVRGGRLLARPAGDVEPIRCAGVRGRVRARTTTRAALDLTGDCAGVGVTLGALRYRGEVDWRGEGTVRSAGQLTAAVTEIGALAGTALAAQVRTGSDGVRARGVRLSIGDGTLQGTGRWLRAAGRRRVALAFEGSGAAAEEALEDAPVRLAGRWVVRGRGRAVATAAASLARGAAGAGRLVILDGAIEPLDVGGALLDGLEVWRGRRRHRLRRRFPDVFGSDGLRYDRLVVRAHGRAGRWDLTPVRVRSRSYRADGRARVGRDGRVQGTMDVVPGPTLSDALLGRGALRAIVAGDREEIRLPVEVSGVPGDLRVRPAPAFAREVLERALGGSTLGKALDRLLDR